MDADMCAGTAVNASMCRCDGDCRRYGDCCADALASPQPEYGPWQCTSHGGREFYVMAKCPSQVDDELSLSCTKKSLRLRTLQDVPVFSDGTRTMYANVFCAACHHDIDSLRAWNVNLHCSRNSGDAGEVTHLLRAKKFRYSATSRSMMYVRSDKSRVTCHLHIDETKDEGFFEDLYGLRECRLHFTGGCLPGADPEDVQRCGQYTAMVYSPKKMANYRNIHCARCHNASLRGLECGGRKAGYNSDTIELKQTVLSLPTTFRNPERCPGTTGIYDPFVDECYDEKEPVEHKSSPDCAVITSSSPVLLLLARVALSILLDW